MAEMDMPDVGSLGGNYYDNSGENSATGGNFSAQQGYANEEVNYNPWGYDFGAAGYDDPGALSFGNFFGYDQPTGLPTSGGTNAGNVNSYGLSDLYNSKAGKGLQALAGMTPVGKVANLFAGVTGMLGKGDYLGAAGRTVGALGGLGGAVANAGIQASRGNFANAGGLAGNLVGGRAGGWAGSELGQMASGRAGGTPGISGVQQGREAGGPDWAGIIGGLGGLYGNRGGGNISGADANNQAVSQQIQSLGNMYSPNSPYAQQLRQELERKDAKAGRRSQYGPREVQLMAALADKQASVSDSMGRLAQTNQANQIALQDRKRLQRGQNLATLGGLAKQSGLLDMFRGGGGGGNTQQAAPVDYGPPAQYDVPDNYNWNQYNNTNSLYGE